MNDWPTHPSILTWKLLIMTQGFGPLNSFLATGTTTMMPGLRPTVSTPLTGVEMNGRRPAKPPVNVKPRTRGDAGATRHRDAVGRAHIDSAADLVTHLEVASRLFRPSQRADEYSARKVFPRRDSGGQRRHGNCVSSLAPRPSVQPSGLLRIAGGFEPARPSAAGAHAGSGGVGISTCRRRADQRHDEANRDNRSATRRRG